MEVVVGEAVVARLRAAGAIVILVPPGDSEAVEPLLDRVHGVVLTGGAFDIHPRHYGQAPIARLDRLDEDRTELEIALVRGALRRTTPILGICGGMQAMAVARGGTLVQDIGAQVAGARIHEQPTDPAQPWHGLDVDAAWIDLLGGDVNSTHHQAVADPADFQVVARAPDGVIEAIALIGTPFTLGVEWHPEILDDRVFVALVNAARRLAG